jgi:hypothetical protein
MYLNKNAFSYAQPRLNRPPMNDSTDQDDGDPEQHPCALRSHTSYATEPEEGGDQRHHKEAQ